MVDCHGSGKDMFLEGNLKTIWMSKAALGQMHLFEPVTLQLSTRLSKLHEVPVAQRAKFKYMIHV